MNIRPLYSKLESHCIRGFFCASSDENIQGKSTAVLAQVEDFSWIFEEHRDSDRAKLWNMSYERKHQSDENINKNINTKGDLSWLILRKMKD